MFKFENQLLKLKHEVLTRVAVLAKENKVTKEEIEKIPYNMISGESPTYRDTVTQERDVVLERAKLAAGYLPNGKEGKDLIDISEQQQILYVIKAACDRCPTKNLKLQMLVETVLHINVKVHVILEQLVMLMDEHLLIQVSAENAVCVKKHVLTMQLLKI
ncbi:hypothetical protein FHU25_000479 [Clostridium saccharobutylicum]|nr:hypothetical protein [Clostridium saccharobutylicum]